eukprot:m.170206 g.170206  ORF g.170206 m.170206 type:complete len:259 (-) comp15274_c0_seq3:379-1155(-)
MRLIPGQNTRPRSPVERESSPEYEEPLRGGAAQVASRDQRRQSRPRHSHPAQADDEYNSDEEHGGARRLAAPQQTAFEVISQLWRQRRWQVIQMAGDGACMFRAIAYHVYGDQEMHDQVRKLCMDYMERNQDHFAEFVVGEDFAAYVARKRRAHEHGNHLEIQAVSEMYSRCIEVYENADGPLNIFQAHCMSDAPMRLLYRHGHYDAIVDPARPAFGVGLGFTDLRPGVRCVLAVHVFVWPLVFVEFPFVCFILSLFL